MIVYLAGPYRAATREGIDANIQAARAVAVQLWEAGFTVICPHLNTAHFNDDCAAPEYTYLAGYLDIVGRCDALVLLPNWKQSGGARAELDQAYLCGLPVYIWPEMPTVGSEDIA